MSTSTEFCGMNEDAARSFAEKWLPAWSGNRPECLIAFYSEDAVYSDPVIRDGVQGRSALHSYFTKLLARNPDWVWEQRGSIPIRDGFLNLWHASIPVNDVVVNADGVCTVQIRDGLIYANHVYFDRSEILRATRDS